MVCRHSSEALRRPVPSTHTHQSTAVLAVRGLFRLVDMWHQRTTQRSALKRLDDRRLNDVGITVDEARKAYEKPFWRGKSATVQSD